MTDFYGNLASCAFNVHSVDLLAPTMVLPSSPTINLDNTGVAALPDYRLLISAADGCTAASQLTIVQTPAPGTVIWGVGYMTINMTVTDAAGNAVSGSFQLSKLDLTAPELTCPENQQYLYDIGEPMILEDYIERGLVSDNVTDNPDILLVQSPAAGTIISEPGITLVTITATDLSGNISSCTFQVVMIIQTKLHFVSSLTTINESNTNVVLSVSIENPSPSSSTSIDVVLTSQNDLRLSSFSTLTLTFPAGSSNTQTAMIQLINDAYCNDISELTFALQNPQGSNNPLVTSNPTHTITIVDDEIIHTNELSENGESAALSGWIQTTPQQWTNSMNGAMTGTYSIRQSTSSALGSSWLTKSMNELSLAGVTTEWQFNINHFGLDPNNDDKFLVYLASNTTELNSATCTGYAIGVNPQSATDPDIIKLWKVNNGVLTEVVSTGYDLGTADHQMGWKVIRDAFGMWSVYLDLNGGFDNLVFTSSASDEQWIFADNFGVWYKHTAATSGQLAIDDISVSQTACSCTYYCIASGVSVSNIWSDQTNGEPEIVVFSKFSNVEILPGNTLTLTAPMVVKNLIIDPSATISAGGNPIYVYGNVIMNGLFNSGTGTMSFNGTGNQVLSGNIPITFNNFVINNNAGTVSLNNVNETKLKGVATIKKGTLATNDRLTLISNSVATASIGVIANNANLTGKITMQRFVVGMTNSNSGGYVGLGCAVQGTTLADWGADFITTGFVGATYPPPYSFNNVSWYNESVAGNMNNGYVYATNITNQLYSDRGYFIYMQPGLQNIDVKGNIYQHEFSVPLSYTNTGTPAADGYNLLVNQYPSEVDFKLIADNGSGISSYSIYDSETNNYKLYNSVLNTGTAPRYIASSQAFFAKASGPGAFLRYKEIYKTNNGIVFERSEGGGGANIARASFKISAANGSSDQAMMVLHNDATPAFDNLLDGGKMLSPSPDAVQCALVSSDNELLTLNAIKSVSENFEIPVHVMIPAAGDYIFSVESINHFRNPGCICIEDLLTGNIIPMAEGQFLTLHADSAYTGNRLVIRNMYSIAITSKDVVCNGEHNGEIMLDYSNPTIQLSISDPTNHIVYSGPAVLAVAGLTAGNYQVSVQYPLPQCSVVLHDVVVKEPLQPSVVLDSFMQGICGVGKGAEVSIEIQNLSGYNYTFFDTDGNVAYSGTSAESLLSLHNLRGEKYHVVIEGECGTRTLDVDLEDVDAVTTHILTDDIFITVVKGSSQQVIIEQESNNEDAVEWSMNNGFTTNEDEFKYDFTEKGTYSVGLKAANQFCNAEDRINVIVDETISMDESGFVPISVILHSEYLAFNMNQTLETDVLLTIHDISGRLLWNYKTSAQQGKVVETSITHFASGIYIIQGSTEGHELLSKKIVK